MTLLTDRLHGGDSKKMTSVVCVTLVHLRGKMKQLTSHLKQHRWDTVGLVEVRWAGLRKTPTNGEQKLWHSGEDTRHKHGMGFLVHTKVVRAILVFHVPQ